MSEEDLDDLTDVLFDAADEDKSGSITFEELKAELEKHPGVIENLTIRSDTYPLLSTPPLPPKNQKKKQTNKQNQKS